MVMRSKGYTLNHKTVLKLMRILDLKGKQRKNETYHSYKGEVGKIADNILKRDFHASKPFEKLATDVTQFKVCDEKVYLSPVMDLYNREIVSYSISTSPNLWQIREMLDGLFAKLPADASPVFHSDQGWQYQHQYYHQFLEDKGIQPSMSRKGNSPDNGMMESFFDILKSEMFYGYEKMFHSLEQLEQAIVDYIDYYNNKLIKVKLKGLISVPYRNKSFV